MGSASIICAALTLLAAVAPTAQPEQRRSVDDRWEACLKGHVLLLARPLAETGNSHKDSRDERGACILCALDLKTGQFDVLPIEAEKITLASSALPCWGSSSRYVYYMDSAKKRSRICEFDRATGKKRFIWEECYLVQVFTAVPAGFQFLGDQECLYVVVQYDLFGRPVEYGFNRLDYPAWLKRRVLQAAEQGVRRWTDICRIDVNGHSYFDGRLGDITSIGEFRLSPDAMCVAHSTTGAKSKLEMLPKAFLMMTNEGPKWAIHIDDLWNPLRIGIYDRYNTRYSDVACDDDSLYMIRPLFSPRGGMLAAIGKYGDQDGLYVSRGPAYERFTRLSESPVIDGSAVTGYCWSPDGQWLLVTDCPYGRESVSFLTAIEVATGGHVRLDLQRLVKAAADSIPEIITVLDWIE